MNLKKISFAVVLLAITVFSGYAQMGLKIGAMGSYNPFNPSYYSFGVMMEVGSEHCIRFGAALGGVTLTYERENIYNSNKEITEYWQKSIYYEMMILGYVFQFGFVDFFSLRIGLDLFMSWAPAYRPPNTAFMGVDSSYWQEFNFGLTGVAGLILFPRENIFISVDVCPGYQLDSFAGKFKEASDHQSDFAFIMPVRITVGLNF